MSLRAVYDVMRRPSAYWATSSGMAMNTRRVSTHPLWPAEVRISDQSSVGSASACLSSSSGRLVFDISSQSGGGLGAGGEGGGAILGFFSSFLMRTGFEGTTRGLRGVGFRGAT